MNKYSIKFFPFVIILVLTFLNFIDVLSSTFVINGEIVYTCGFLIVFYVIWGEVRELYNTALKPQFGYSEVAHFWVKFMKIERSILSLIILKIKTINDVLVLFSLTSTILKLLHLLQVNIIDYKTLVQLLNKIKLKIKALPLQ